MISLGALNDAHFLIPLSPHVVGVIFFIFLCVWATYSWILLYHWRNYGTSKLEVATMSIIYFAGSAIIIVLTALAFSAYSLSAL